jgi:OmpA-OmpF porin, OOP family
MAEVLGHYPKTRVIVSGYTDSQASEEYSLQLPERRASSVGSSLISRGVRQKRMAAVGLGESDPVDTNQTTQGQQNNRRVELGVLSDRA